MGAYPFCITEAKRQEDYEVSVAEQKAQELLWEQEFEEAARKTPEQEVALGSSADRVYTYDSLQEPAGVSQHRHSKWHSEKWEDISEHSKKDRELDSTSLGFRRAWQRGFLQKTPCSTGTACA